MDIGLDYTGVIHDAGNGNIVQRSIVDGVRILTEEMPAQRSASIGFWLAVGSRDEAEDGHGATHFLEHLLFKGTDKYTAADISNAFDRVGGEFNAATAKEFTCYHARVLDTDLPMAIDILTSMVTSATLDAELMDVERGVILEELAMDSHDPTNVGHEKLAAHALGSHPLGRPIGGTKEAIGAITHEHMVAHYRRHYRPEELVITVAGGVNHEEVVRRVADALPASWHNDISPAPRRITKQPAVLEPGRYFTPLPVEQSAVMLGGTGMNTHDEQRFALSVMNVILGGGMSSRLFQEIREKRGLAYTTYALSAGYSDVGYFGLYAGCNPRVADQVSALLEEELEKLSNGVTDEEMERAHGQISGSIVLALEDTGSRMSRLGRAELVSGEYLGIDASLQRIRTVDAEQVKAVAERFAASERIFITVGPDVKESS